MNEQPRARVVIVESPYAGCVPLHEAYLNAIIRQHALANETPYPSHKVLTQSLDDKDPAERALGIRLGIDMRDTLLDACSRSGIPWPVSVFWTDFGWSHGMLAARDSLDVRALAHAKRCYGDSAHQVDECYERVRGELYEERELPPDEELWENVLTQVKDEGFDACLRLATLEAPDLKWRTLALRARQLWNERAEQGLL